MDDGGWFPVDNNITRYLPKGGKYDMVHALVSLQSDLSKTGKLKPIRYYSKLWSWPYSNVRKLLCQVENQNRIKNESPIRLINSNLQHFLDQNRIKTESVLKEDNKEEKKGGKFTPPTPEEVQAYMDSISFRESGSHFCDFYESKGWMVGSNKMKNWKACVRTWKTKNNGKGTHQPCVTPEWL